MPSALTADAEAFIAAPGNAARALGVPRSVLRSDGPTSIEFAKLCTNLWNPLIGTGEGWSGRPASAPPSAAWSASAGGMIGLPARRIDSDPKGEKHDGYTVKCGKGRNGQGRIFRSYFSPRVLCLLLSKSEIFSRCACTRARDGVACGLPPAHFLSVAQSGPLSVYISHYTHRLRVCAACALYTSSALSLTPAASHRQCTRLYALGRGP